MNRQLLEQPFPEQAIKNRKGYNGKQFHYVEGAMYIKRLNDAFDGNWSFDIVEHQIQATEVIVLGRLTADGVVKSAFGGSTITTTKDTGAVLSIADDLKAAATDALKKACTLLGIGLHLYFKEKQPEQKPAASFRAAPNIEKVTEKQLSAIWSLVRNIGIDTNEFRERCIEMFNSVPEALSKRDASVLIQKLSDESRGAA